MEITEKKGWSPYFAGALNGLLSILSVWIAGKQRSKTMEGGRRWFTHL